MDTKIIVWAERAIEMHFSSFPPIQLFPRNTGINFPCLFAEGQKQTPFIYQKLCLDSGVPTTPCTNTYVPRMCLQTHDRRKTAIVWDHWSTSPCNPNLCPNQDQYQSWIKFLRAFSSQSLKLSKDWDSPASGATWRTALIPEGLLIQRAALDISCHLCLHLTFRL